ncbi:uncharacterized protein LOC128628569 [Artibeus jamaicensis]|uniref:uncharacterized protein LOC128628569 n=1 Tax=Artibeus jamaicensis TaxID=9417 RepID=UPI00235A826A|nr:uncharacterized protein LOC128628569 [Artibeus jamaicensis]
MKSELESFKENNVKQSFQIMSLKNDIKDLEELIASLTRIKSLKSINVHSLERVNWDLNERIMELENRLRIHLVEKEKAEQKTKLLEKKLAGANELTPRMNTKGQEDTLGSFMIKDKGKAILAKNCERDNIFHSEGPKDGQKIWDKCQEDLIHTEKQKYTLDRPPYSSSWEAKAVQCHSQEFLSQLAPLLSDSAAPVPATEEAEKERIQEVGANDQSWKSRTEGLQQEIQMLTKRLEQVHPHHREESSQTEEKCGEQKRPLKRLDSKENSRSKNSRINGNSKMFKQLEKDNKQQTLLNIKQNLQIATTQRLEGEIQELQKQLSDLKLSNKNMKTQLTRVNILKDKTIQKLRQSLIKVEAMRGKAVGKSGNLKTPLDSAKQEASWDKDRAHQVVDAVTPGLCTAKSALENIVVRICTAATGGPARARYGACALLSSSRNPAQEVTGERLKLGCCCATLREEEGGDDARPGHIDSKPAPHSALGSSGLPHSCSLSYLQKSWALNAASRGQSGRMRDSEGRMQGWALAPVELEETQRSAPSCLKRGRLRWPSIFGACLHHLWTSLVETKSTLEMAYGESATCLLIATVSGCPNATSFSITTWYGPGLQTVVYTLWSTAQRLHFGNPTEAGVGGLELPPGGVGLRNEHGESRSRDKEFGTIRDLPAAHLVVTWALGFSLSTSLSRIFKRKKRLLVKSQPLFAVSPATGRFDTHSPAPAARTTYRNLLGRGGGERGILWGCGWHPGLRVGWRSVSGLHRALALRGWWPAARCRA